jgi:hypothetical protein
MDRYSSINEHLKRELLLLQGLGCVWRKCTFCDYYEDKSNNPFELNKQIIDQITGIYRTVDIINSGSIFELDKKTKEYLKEKLIEKNIETMWCETHFIYRNKLDDIRKFFYPIKVKFRVGAETFDPILRDQWQKGIPFQYDAKDIAKYFDGVCLLVCVKGQTKEIIINDIKKAYDNFEYFNINVFNPNSTKEELDSDLLDWFKTYVYPKLLPYDNIEVLIDNTDLGVGEKDKF